MTQSNRDGLRKEFHPQAEELAKEISQKFTAELLAVATMLAQGDEIVLSRHIEQAEVSLSVKRKAKRYPDILIAVGSLAFGVFLPWFFELKFKQSITPQEVWWYAGLGALGIASTIIGFMSKHISRN